MGRLIDADMLEPSEVYMNYGFTRIVYMDDIDELPTVDAEPVVRCDDCIYRDGKTPGQPNILCWQMHADDFCSYGTKREVGTYCKDIVTVVRCKDCKFFDHSDFGKGEECWCKHFVSTDDTAHCHRVDEDDFCADGERREDAETD